jgi:tryptophan synthase alpha subunit
VPLPVALGFGIATADDAKRVAPLADAVVVGTAAVRATQNGPAALEVLVRSLIREA